MDNESALRDYFDVLIRRWNLVLVTVIVAMVAAALVSLLQPPTFEARAIVALAPATLSVPTSNQVPPYYLLVDSPHQLPTAYTPTYYIALLKSAEVVNAVSPRVSVFITPNSADKSLIEITVRGSDRNVVAQTANAWADLGAQYITKILIPTGEQAATAQRKLDAADQALIKFSQDNGLGEYDLAKLRAATALATNKRLELMQLLRARDIAESVYLDLARDQTRAEILGVTAYRPTPIPAPVPDAPVSPQPVQNSLIGAAFGLLIGVIGAFAMEYMARGTHK